MGEKQDVGPENTAVRVALWRALHLEVDSPPHVLEDGVGLKLVAPEGPRSDGCSQTAWASFTPRYTKTAAVFSPIGSSSSTWFISR